MVKSDIFWEIAHKVADVCQINIDDMMSDLKEQKLVEARILTVQYAIRVGFTPAQIAEIVLAYQGVPSSTEELRKKARMVSNVNRAYVSKCQQSNLFCILSKEVKAWVKENYGVGMDI